MNNSTCFTETTTICLVWQIIFIILNCLTDSVLQLYLSINMFSFQDLPHLQEKKFDFDFSQQTVPSAIPPACMWSDTLTFSPAGPSGTSWDGSSFSKFLIPGSAPFLISSFTASAWVLWLVRELTMCSAVFPLNVWKEWKRHHMLLFV